MLNPKINSVMKHASSNGLEGVTADSTAFLQAVGRYRLCISALSPKSCVRDGSMYCTEGYCSKYGKWPGIFRDL